jgi:pilus assembly protein Flp/PilA
MNSALAHILGIVGVLQARIEGSKDRGATAVEYGLLVGLIAAVIITVVGLLGTRINVLFGNVLAGL